MRQCIQTSALLFKQWTIKKFLFRVLFFKCIKLSLVKCFHGTEHRLHLYEALLFISNISCIRTIECISLVHYLFFVYCKNWQGSVLKEFKEFVNIDQLLLLLLLSYHDVFLKKKKILQAKNMVFKINTFLPDRAYCTVVLMKTMLSIWYKLDELLWKNVFQMMKWQYLSILLWILLNLAIRRFSFCNRVQIDSSKKCWIV